MNPDDAAVLAAAAEVLDGPQLLDSVFAGAIRDIAAVLNDLADSIERD